MKKYIPIIGTISAGKSTFLKALLGINVLQSGSATTTKFICLIKNSSETSFYHVIPIEGKGIEFEKEGEEIKGDENIKKKIMEINDDLANRKGTKDDVFYVLETPIKYIENVPLLEQCYFMDIPGLNENLSSYIEIIFSLITMKDILFEIMVFDSTSIGSDNILNIFKELEEKKCLKKNNNLFILNKIDQCTVGGKGGIIDSFKQYFYQTFEDEKKEENISINIYQNYFVPMNSLLYLAETKINEDFYSLLVFELFTYLEYSNKEEVPTFFEFIQKRIEKICGDENLELEKDVKKVGEKEWEIISKSIEDLKKILNFIQKDENFQFGINLTKKGTEKELKKLFLIHKNNNYHCVHTDYYNELQEILKNIDINEVDLASPPGINNSDTTNIINQTPNEENEVQNNIEEGEEKKNKNVDVSTIEELENFLTETFQIIDPKNELKNFRISLQSLRENILGRKLRIAFIGNISVGKSTVLNCIIGDEILPTKESECTYRGVILRYKDIDKFELYRTKLITRGTGLDEYYYFETMKEPYCRGKNEIKSYLQNKNNDKVIEDNDAYIVICGRLKIFNFIQIDKELINIIEFIDLPGPDRKNNTFNEKQYYKKILKFSNCCIYINAPNTIDDKNSVKRMTDQYLSDKDKVFPVLRDKFIHSCLFLINKSDNIENDKDRQNILNNLFKNMKLIEKDIKIDDMNISFFSGKNFNHYLDIYKLYIELLNDNPYQFIYKFIQDYRKTLISLRGFKNFIKNKLNKIEEDFDLNLDEETDIPEEFENTLQECFDELNQKNYINLSKKDQNEIIEKLYIAKQQFSLKDVSNTVYSYKFFDKLKEVMKYSEDLQKESLNKSIIDFFKYTDELFAKELTKQNEKEKLENKRKLEIIKEEIIPSAKSLFEETEKKISNLIQNGRKEALGIIQEELDNIEIKLKNVEKDLDKASQLLQQKITEIVERVRGEQKLEIENLMKKIEELLEKKLEKNIDFDSSTSTSKINTNTGLTKKMIISIFSSVVSGIAVRAGLIFIGEAALTGATAGVLGGVATSSTIGGALMGPVGIAIGFGVGLTISVGTALIHYFSKTKRYKKGVEQFKNEIINKFDDSERNTLDDFRTYKDEFFKEINIKLELLEANLESIDEEKWESIKNNYKIKKGNIMEKINKMH